MPQELRGAMAALYTSTDSEVLVEGRAGTSKTTGIITKLVRDCSRYPGCRVLVCRKTRKSLTESVMVTFDRMITPGMEGYAEATREHRNNNTFANGSTIVWKGLDQPEGLFSTEWDRIYVPEATELHSINEWDLFGRSLRNNKTPYHQRIADCNPGPPGHWLNQRGTPCGDEIRDSWKTRDDYNRLQQFNHYAHETTRASHPLRRLVSVHPDNPGYWDLTAWNWTPFGNQYVNSTLASMTGHRRARMFDGRWVAAEGAVFPEFIESRHTINPFRIPDHWPIYVGIDPGYDHPCAILWFAVADNGCLYVFDEIHRGGLSVAEHAVAIKQRNAPSVDRPNGRQIRRYFADPQDAVKRTMGQPAAITTQFSRCGLTVGTWPRSTDVDAMVEAVRDLLKQERLKVFRSCQATIAEFQSWRYKRNTRGELPAGDDQFEDANNDAMDVVKGIVAAGVHRMQGIRIDSSNVQSPGSAFTDKSVTASSARLSYRPR